MKKFYIFLLAFSLMVVSSSSFSSYIIEFTNGNQILTNQYWEDGDKIKCDLYGGIASFHKDSIKAIRLSDLPYTYEKPSSENKGDGVGKEGKADEKEDMTGKEDAKGQTAGNGAKTTPPLTEIEIIELKKEKSEIAEQYVEAGKEYTKAKSAGDMAGMKTANEKFLNLKKQEASLVKRVKDRNMGSLPDWWSPPSENAGEEN